MGTARRLFSLAAMPYTLENSIVQRRELLLASAEIGLIMSIIIGPRFILSLVFIPSKCPPGIHFQILSNRLWISGPDLQAVPPLHPPGSCSPHCGPRLTYPFPFICHFIFRAPEKKCYRGVILCKEAGFCWVAVPFVCPLGSLAVGTHTSEDKEGLFHGQAASQGPAACQGSSLPAHEPTEKSQVLWAPLSKEREM